MWVCEVCGFSLSDKPDIEWVCLCNPRREKTPCKHRLEPTGRVHYIAGDYSSLEETEYKCGHKETAEVCVTTASADQAVDICRFCEHYEPVEVNLNELYQANPGLAGRELANERMNCVNLGAATEEQVEVTGCKGCKTAIGMTTVFECEIHNHCTPLGKAKHDRSLHPCHECGDYQAKE